MAANLRLVQVKTRSLEVYLGLLHESGAQVLGPSYTTSPGALAGMLDGKQSSGDLNQHSDMEYRQHLTH